jgi:hypothetical protein
MAHVPTHVPTHVQMFRCSDAVMGLMEGGCLGSCVVCGCVSKGDRRRREVR